VYCEIVVLLDHSPFVVVSFCPTCAVPLIAGAVVGAGWPYSYWAELEDPEATPLVTSSTAAPVAIAASRALSGPRALIPCFLIDASPLGSEGPTVETGVERRPGRDQRFARLL
jgi:hypothetical protein